MAKRKKIGQSDVKAAISEFFGKDVDISYNEAGDVLIRLKNGTKVSRGFVKALDVFDLIEKVKAFDLNAIRQSYIIRKKGFLVRLARDLFNNQ